ncbi:cytochrome P450 [Coprinopsis cinerea AmutBmut pab1-1]|nr:cytochrome P450 [Coprinopsis cinerea AmutBmut pab1-1]
MKEETLTFLRNLLDEPETFMSECRSLFAHTVIRVSYGGKDFDYNRELIQDAEEIVDRIATAVTPGRYMVNVFPILKYVPSWFPGAGWKRHLLKGAAITEKIITRPFKDARARLVSVVVSFDRYSTILGTASERSLYGGDADAVGSPRVFESPLRLAITR